MTPMTSSFNEHVCGFCNSNVHHGAEVCAACGAHKGTHDEAGGHSLWPGLVLTIFGVILISAGWNHEPDFSHPYHYISWFDIGVGFVLFVVASLMLYSTVKSASKKTWLRRN